VTRLALSALAAGTILPACTPSGGPALGTPPDGAAASSAASPWATASASASGPPLTRDPTTPSGPRPEGAVAAARAYIAAFNLAAQTGDTTAYDAVVSAGCACRQPFLSSFVDALRTHHWHTDARRVVVRVTVVRRRGPGALVDVSFRVDPYRVLDATGRTVRAGRSDRGVLRISLVRAADGWLVVEAVRR
jgi:hypothetical protein